MGEESAETIVGSDSRDSTFNQEDRSRLDHLGYTEGLEKCHHVVQIRVLWSQRGRYIHFGVA